MARFDSVLYIAAAVSTAIPGMLHLMLALNSLNFNVNQGILFIVGGIAQVFWIIPVIRRWGTPWYAIGIAGTIVFMALWIITRMPGNPITGRGGPAGNPMAITIEVFQAAFIGLAIAIIIYEHRKKKKGQQEVEKSVTRASGRKHVPILGGIVIALILIGLFALPMLMPGPMGGGGGPPRQGGGGGESEGALSPPSTSGAGQFGPPPGQAPTQETSANT
jgi:hypothetical protein